MQLKQFSMSSQFVSPQYGAHAPQSPGQLLQSSPPLQNMSPHDGSHEPQSSGQVLQYSMPPHTPSPQPAMLPVVGPDEEEAPPDEPFDSPALTVIVVGAGLEPKPLSDSSLPPAQDRRVQARSQADLRDM
jgi:hypothetical protein